MIDTPTNTTNTRMVTQARAVTASPRTARRQMRSFTRAVLAHPEHDATMPHDVVTFADLVVTASRRRAQQARDAFATIVALLTVVDVVEVEPHTDDVPDFVRIPDDPVSSLIAAPGAPST